MTGLITTLLQCSGLQRAATRANENLWLSSFFLVKLALAQRRMVRMKPFLTGPLLFKHRHFETFTSAQPESSHSIRHRTKSWRMPGWGIRGDRQWQTSDWRQSELCGAALTMFQIFRENRAVISCVTAAQARLHSCDCLCWPGLASCHKTEQ